MRILRHALHWVNTWLDASISADVKGVVFHRSSSQCDVVRGVCGGSDLNETLPLASHSDCTVGSGLVSVISSVNGSGESELKPTLPRTFRSAVVSPIL